MAGRPLARVLNTYLLSFIKSKKAPFGEDFFRGTCFLKVRPERRAGGTDLRRRLIWHTIENDATHLGRNTGSP